jgi:hypothetical protein
VLETLFPNGPHEPLCVRVAVRAGRRNSHAM